MSVVRAVKDRLKTAFPEGAAAWLRLKELGYRVRSRGRHLEVVFGGIHDGNLWGEPESVSGPGSSLAETEAVRRELPGLLRELKVRTLLDAPCGDGWWITQTPLELDGYLGIDIIPELIARNRERYRTPWLRFEVRDATRDPLPRADVILCRDLLIHFSYRYIRLALESFRRSGSAYLLTTTYQGLPANRDILTGQWRPIDLELPPFGFPPPLRRIVEKECELDGLRLVRSLGLWRLADL